MHLCVFVCACANVRAHVCDLASLILLEIIIFFKRKEKEEEKVKKEKRIRNTEILFNKAIAPFEGV